MDKQWFIHNGILLSNKTEWTIDMCYDVDESQNNYSDWNKPDNKRVHIIRFNLYNILENAN